MIRKMFALLAALVLLSSCHGACAEENEGIYVLMTIPYELFYEAETTGGQYDAVSSATRVKPLMMKYSGGSFHFMRDGREITGVVFPVHAESEEQLAMCGTEITDASSVTITVKENGKKVTTTYRGKDALFESFPFSYYKLSEVPAVYKEMISESSFGPMQGLVVELDGMVKKVDNSYAKVCLSVEGADDVLSELNVNAVVLAGDDGTRVGLKHVENIWFKTLFGFNYDSEVYSLLQGRKLDHVEIYTFDAKYVISAGNEIRID